MLRNFLCGVTFSFQAARCACRAVVVDASNAFGSNLRQIVDAQPKGLYTGKKVAHITTDMARKVFGVTDATPAHVRKLLLDDLTDTERKRFNRLVGRIANNQEPADFWQALQQEEAFKTLPEREKKSLEEVYHKPWADLIQDFGQRLYHQTHWTRGTTETTFDFTKAHLEQNIDISTDAYKPVWSVSDAALTFFCEAFALQRLWAKKNEVGAQHPQLTDKAVLFMQNQKAFIDAFAARLKVWQKEQYYSGLSAAIIDASRGASASGGSLGEPSGALKAGTDVRNKNDAFVKALSDEDTALWAPIGDYIAYMEAHSILGKPFQTYVSMDKG